MNKKELIKKIMQKREYSQLPKRDVEIAFKRFDCDKYIDEEKVKLTRNLLRQVFSSFTSQKILSLKSLKNKNEEWILRKHLSTRERLPYYEEVYKRILKSLKKEISIIDLGAGVNGFSYKYLRKLGFSVNYLALEAIGQLTELTNYYFKKEKINGRAFHLSLFEIEKVKEIIKKQKRPRIVLLFKTIDSLEMLERNYSKKLISEISLFVDRVIISFATRSMQKRKSFRVKRNWIINFIKGNFKVLDDFELGGERYIVFNKE